MVRTRRSGTASSSRRTTENPTPQCSTRGTAEKQQHVRRKPNTPQSRLISSPESDSVSQSELANPEEDSGRNDNSNLASVASCPESEAAVTTPNRQNVATTADNGRSSERIRSRKNREFHMPTRRELFEKIGEAPKTPIKRVRKKLASTFSRETHRYNWDDVYYNNRLESDESSASDFIDDEDETSSDEDKPGDDVQQEAPSNTSPSVGTHRRWRRLTVSGTSSSSEEDIADDRKERCSTQSVQKDSAHNDSTTRRKVSETHHIATQEDYTENDSAYGEDGGSRFVEADLRIEADDELEAVMLHIDHRERLTRQESYRETGIKPVLPDVIVSGDEESLLMVSNSDEEVDGVGVRVGVEDVLGVGCAPVILTEQEQKTHWPTPEAKRSRISSSAMLEASDQRAASGSGDIRHPKEETIHTEGIFTTRQLDVDDEEVTPTRRKAMKAPVIHSDSDTTCDSDATIECEDGKAEAVDVAVGIASNPKCVSVLQVTPMHETGYEPSVDSDSESVNALKVTPLHRKRANLIIDSDDDGEEEEGMSVESAKSDFLAGATIPSLQSSGNMVSHRIVDSEEEDGSMPENPIPTQSTQASVKLCGAISEILDYDDSTSCSDPSSDDITTDGENEHETPQQVESRDSNGLVANSSTVPAVGAVNNDAESRAHSESDTSECSRSDSGSGSSEDIRGCSKRARLMKSKKDAWRQKFEHYKRARTKSTSIKGTKD